MSLSKILITLSILSTPLSLAAMAKFDDNDIELATFSQASLAESHEQERALNETILRAIRLNQPSKYENLTDTESIASYKDQYNNTALFYACQVGQKELVSKLLAMGANPNEECEYTLTPFWCALINEHLPCLKILIERNTDVNKPIGKSLTPLLYATKTEKNACVSLLLEANAKGAGLALHYAAASGNKEAIELLLEKRRINSGSHFFSSNSFLGSNTIASHVNRYKQNALHIAVKENNVHCLHALVKGGVSLTATDSYGNTPLCIAAAHGFTHCMRELLELGAETSGYGMPLSNYGMPFSTLGMQTSYRALDHAANAGHIDCLDILSKSCDPRNLSVVAVIGVLTNQPEVLTWALSKKVDVEKIVIEKSSRAYGWAMALSDERPQRYSLLMLSVAYGMSDITKILLEAGCGSTANLDSCEKTVLTSLENDWPTIKTREFSNIEKLSPDLKKTKETERQEGQKRCFYLLNEYGIVKRYVTLVAQHRRRPRVLCHLAAHGRVDELTILLAALAQSPSGRGLTDYILHNLIKNEYGTTSKEDKIKCFTLLLENGADSNAPDHDGCSPIDRIMTIFDVYKSRYVNEYEMGTDGFPCAVSAHIGPVHWIGKARKNFYPLIEFYTVLVKHGGRPNKLNYEDILEIVISSHRYLAQNTNSQADTKEIPKYPLLVKTVLSSLALTAIQEVSKGTLSHLAHIIKTYLSLQIPPYVIVDHLILADPNLQKMAVGLAMRYARHQRQLPTFSSNEATKTSKTLELLLTHARKFHMRTSCLLELRKILDGTSDIFKESLLSKNFSRFRFSIPRLRKKLDCSSDYDYLFDPQLVDEEYTDIVNRQVELLSPHLS